MISEEVAIERVKRKKFKIPMSDKPGSYEEEMLRTLLVKYLSKDLKSSKRIRLVLLPACLENEVVTRNQLKEEFVKRGEAEDTTRAGYFLTLISGQVGMEKNDFLRQVIGYDYPSYSWEKDNYHIREGYHDLVKDVLQELSEVPTSGETGSANH